MAGNNEDYRRRLKRDGRIDLIKRIDDPLDEMTLYAACIQMGYRKRQQAKSRSEHLTYHWRRADAVEKQRFIIDNLNSMGPLVAKIVKKLKSSDEDKKDSS